jgi:DNA-binding MarR family transcriptional regulator
MTRTTTSYYSLIEVSVDDFKKVNAAVIRLLLTLYESGGPMSSRRLYESAGMSRVYGPKMIKKAEQQGYVTRKRVRKPRGEKGNHMMINSLTPKAKRLLNTLELT